MYRTCAIGPTILVTTLANASKTLLRKNSKIIFVSSESGSITLRHEKEGGGNYGHHASKTALNMSAKLLSLDLKDRGVAVAVVHPGFMRTEMTKGVGFDKFWDEGGAVTPDVAAESLAKWIETFDIGKTGEYWAPRGPGSVVIPPPSALNRLTLIVISVQQSQCLGLRTSFQLPCNYHGKRGTILLSSLNAFCDVIAPLWFIFKCPKITALPSTMTTVHSKILFHESASR